jgi:hypothetical protein
LQRGLENLLPTPEPPQRCLDYLAAKTDRNIALFTRKLGELCAVFVAARKMGKQIFDCFDAQPSKCEKFRTGYPI